jgi:hypothetical protein
MYMNFAGIGFSAVRVEPVVTQTIINFLPGVRGEGCILPLPEEGMTLLAK